MYFFNCTCLCLSGYKPYIIKKTKFESDCQIIGSAQNESFHARKMKRTCFNPCRGLRGFRRSRPAALTSNQPKGVPVAPMTLRAPSRSHLYNPGCRVATLLVLMGVMGFLGDLREDRSRARPVGGSARRSIPSEREQPCCDL